ARIDQALASASALVEGYVAAMYQYDPSLPIPVPLLLIDATCDIARFRLYRTAPPEDVASRNASAIRTLEGIRSGKIKLDTGVETLAPRPGKVLSQGSCQLMGRERLKGF
ncbi:MAG: DUF1320 domain-containing protein, partial [Pseudomonadota bacterium]|nr:DUF1320 domain-containing protein [Pseudomonadota bacterium]